MVTATMADFFAGGALGNSHARAEWAPQELADAATEGAR